MTDTITVFSKYLNQNIFKDSNESVFNTLKDELLECYDKNITQEESIELSELKEIIKNYETYDNKDLLTELNTIIDEILIKHINDYIEDVSSTTLEDDDTESSMKPLERTDYDLIPIDKVVINTDAEDIFNSIIQQEDKNQIKIDYYFSDPRCKYINNKCIKDKTNPYGLDAYGLVIRKNALNKKSSEYGWKLDNIGRPVHIDIKPTCTREQNINNVLNIQYQRNPRAFKLKGVINIIYSNAFPERLNKYLNGIEELIH